MQKSDIHIVSEYDILTIGEIMNDFIMNEI